jgi:hypothetical protein
MKTLDVTGVEASGLARMGVGLNILGATHGASLAPSAAWRLNEG